MPQPPAANGPVVRWRLDLRYDGTQFSGWARQPGLRTVQGELEAVLARVLRLDAVRITVAGRTDAGVHARGQVAHLDLASGDVPAGTLAEAAAVLLRRLGGALPADLAVVSCTPAAEGFDARFSAIWRRYVYRLNDDPTGRDPLRRHDVVPWRHRLDVEAMAAATAPLVGLHDFAAYCRARDGATTIRTLQQLRCHRPAPGRVEIEVRADAFCHSMVRSLVGALVAVGDGRVAPAWPGTVLAAGERIPQVRVMPAAGLTLEEVGYPDTGDLATQADRARALRTLPVEEHR